MKNTTYGSKNTKQNRMTTKNLDLNAMGLIPMNDAEMQEIIGGSFLSWVGAAVGAVVGFVTGGPVGAAFGAAAGYAIGSALNGDSGTEVTVNGNVIYSN